ncbi:MAG: T9SS type A sorting domain-containing protein [Candidatus Marinimicrobia bacterium]|nr:T9SS type A sorting domain-containing protein [Candidatus Neomarinimicrobiota bacterium]
MKKLLLVILSLGLSAMMFAQSWEVVMEAEMLLDPGLGPNGGTFLDASGWLVNDEGLVMKTTDGGNTWSVTREAVAGSEDWVAVDFVDANVGYACAAKGEIYKTTDGGINWTMVSDTAYTDDLKALDAVTADVVYLCGNDGCLLKTTDGGTTFVKSDSTFGGEDLDGGIAFTNASTGVVLADGNGGPSWYTHDGGATWTYVGLAAYFPPGTSSSRMYDIAAVGDQTFIITGYHYVTLISTDGGVNYTRVGGLSYGYDRNYIVEVVDANTFFLAGDFLVRTQDGGATFDTLWTGSGQTYSIVEFTDADTGFVCQANGMWKTTTDGGQTWSNISEWPAVSFWGIGIPNDNTLVITGWGGGEITVSKDGGKNFDFPNNYASHSNENLYECEFMSPTNGLIGGGSGLLLKTTDGGTSYTLVENPMYLNTNKHINAMHVYNQNVAFVGGSSGYVMKTSDGGVTWSDTKLNSGTVYDICALDENTVITSQSSGKVTYGVFDASGAVIKDSLIIDVGNNAMRAVKVRNGVVIIPASAGKIYRATVSDLAAIEEIFTEPDGDDLYDVEFVSDNLVYVVGENGKIYRSEDAGITWIAETSPTTGILQKIKLANTKVWAVGQGGAIISLNLVNEPELMTIAAAKVDADTNGVLDYLDMEVKVKGIITSPNFGSKCQYYMQDETAGIVLYGSAAIEVNIGDEVQVIGKIAEYAGISEVVIDDAADVVVLSTGNVVEPTPIKITQLGEAYEAMLVEVEPVQLDLTQWPAAGSNGSVDVTDGTNTSYIYIDKDSDLDEWTAAPAGWIRMIALCDQYNDGYSFRGTVTENFVSLTPALPMTETFDGGDYDLEWSINTSGGDGSLEIADSSASAWGSHVGVYTDAGYTGLLHVKDAVMENYTVSADIHIIGPADANAPLYSGLGIKMANNDLAYYRVVYRNSSSADNGQIKLQGFDGTNWHISAAWNAGTDYAGLETGWHNFKVTVVDNQFWVFIDGVEMPGCPYVDESPFLEAGYPGIYKYNTGSSSILFDNFTVESPMVPVSVTFNCNMSVQIANGHFTAGVDNLDLAGNFNGWGGTASILTDEDNDQIYTTTVTGLTAGQTLEYKFRINSNWDTSEFPNGGPNRVYVVPDTNSTVTHFYNDVTTPNALDDEEKLPTEFALHQNYPNPFNPTTSISFDLPKDATVILDIYNLQGQRVAKIKNEVMPAGYYTVNIDASHLSSGVYIYKIQADNFVSMKKMTLLK